MSRAEATAAYRDVAGLNESTLATYESDVATTRNEVDSDDFGEAVWAELRRRKRILKGGYPFKVRGDLLEEDGDLASAPSFFFLLGVAMNARFPGARQDKAVDDGRKAETLFEHVVTAAAKGLFGGAAVRFGWPADTGDHKSIVQRIRDLAEKLEVTAEKLDGKIDAAEKDIGLDVVGRLLLGDSEFGTVTFLVQCATGRNWESKKAEPPADRWEDLIHWESKLVRAVAVPWWWAKRCDYKRGFRRFNKAVVLDRARILLGRPDDGLARADKNSILRWTEAQVAQLPML